MQAIKTSNYSRLPNIFGSKKRKLQLHLELLTHGKNTRKIYHLKLKTTLYSENRNIIDVQVGSIFWPVQLFSSFTHRQVQDLPAHPHF